MLLVMLVRILISAYCKKVSQDSIANLPTMKSRCVSILTEHMMMSFMGHLQLVTGVEKTLCR